jgi:hypothetical protein
MGLWMVCVCAGVSATAHAGVLALTPMADNTLFEDSLGGLSNGAGESFFTGKTGSFLLRRGLVRFDLSTIPAGSTITSVELSLSCTRSASLDEPVSLHRALASWGEGTSVSLGQGGQGAPATTDDATWLFRFFGSPATTWTSPGGDFAAAASATRNIGGEARYTYASTAGLVADAQTWLDAPASNFGWFVIGAEDVTQGAKRFASRENPTASLRPELRVTYIPAPSAMALFAGAAMLGARRRRSLSSPV